MLLRRRQRELDIQKAAAHFELRLVSSVLRTWGMYTAAMQRPLDDRDLTPQIAHGRHSPPPSAFVSCRQERAAYKPAELDGTEYAKIRRQVRRWRF